MFDNKVHDLRIILEKEFKDIDINWECKEFSDILAQYFKTKFLKDKNLNIRIHYKDFSNYNIYNSNILNKENSNNLLGYNRLFNGNGDIIEFFGFYFNILDMFTQSELGRICSVYIIMFYRKDKNKIGYYIPEKGNTIKFKSFSEEGKTQFNFIEKDNNAFLDFFEIKKDIFKFFFNNDTKYNEDLAELFDVIKILSDDKNISNLIDNFNKKHF